MLLHPNWSSSSQEEKGNFGNLSDFGKQEKNFPCQTLCQKESDFHLPLRTSAMELLSIQSLKVTLLPTITLLKLYCMQISIILILLFFLSLYPSYFAMSTLSHYSMSHRGYNAQSLLRYTCSWNNPKLIKKINLY